MGAKRIIRNVIFIITSYNPLNTSVKRVRVLFVDVVMKNPKSIAKNITGSMFPSAIALTILLGTMATIWSIKETSVLAMFVTVSFNCKSTPTPGSKVFTRSNPNTQAIRVVII